MSRGNTSAGKRRMSGATALSSWRSTSARASNQRWLGTGLDRGTIDIENSVHRVEYERQLARLTGTRQPSRFKLGPEAVTSALIHALESHSPRLRYRVTVLTKAVAILKRILPGRWLDRLIARNS